jgi:hypothetical protein
MDMPRLAYKPGWSFKIGGPLNGFLCVFATTPDSWHPEQNRCTQHMFRLPDPMPDRRAFARWVFDCLLLCEQHEAGEFFRIDGLAPFYPHHQEEGDPYERVEKWEDSCRSTP